MECFVGMGGDSLKILSGNVMSGTNVNVGGRPRLLFLANETETRFFTESVSQTAFNGAVASVGFNDTGFSFWSYYPNTTVRYTAVM